MAPPTRPLDERLWEKVSEAPCGCWIFTGSKPSGYGRIAAGGRGNGPLQAHRVAYEIVVGKIPDGLVLDHLCRNPACVRPDHLEPVTNAENVRRGLRGRLTTACPQGHAYTPENTYVYRGHRYCRRCRGATRFAAAAPA